MEGVAGVAEEVASQHLTLFWEPEYRIQNTGSRRQV
jgi:hypothetical protein